MFPKVTYDWREFSAHFADDAFIGCSNFLAYYSSRDKGLIWLREPSAKSLLHEFGHHIGFKLKFNKKWHWIIERIL